MLYIFLDILTHIIISTLNSMSMDSTRKRCNMPHNGSPIVFSPAAQNSGQNNAPESRSSLISRNITIDDHRTSVRLEPDMWIALREICRREHTSLHSLCTEIADRKPQNSSLTAAIRVFIMAYYRAAATEDGHSKAGHGPGGYFLGVPKKYRSTYSTTSYGDHPRHFVPLKASSKNS
jgi:predicted DNA-binding ribbon-helix-helix protein